MTLRGGAQGRSGEAGEKRGTELCRDALPGCGAARQATLQPSAAIARQGRESGMSCQPARNSPEGIAAKTLDGGVGGAMVKCRSGGG